MEIIFALLIVAGLAWIFLRDSTPAVNHAEFQRMADEYSQSFAFTDEVGLIQTDCDILIDMWLSINTGTRGVCCEEAPAGINGEVERHYGGAKHPS